MTTLQDDLRAAGSIEDAAARLGDALGLDGPAPLPATRRALSDAQFAKAIFALRNMAPQRDQMLAAPHSARITGQNRAGASPSSARVLAKAAGAVLKWGMEGLQHAPPWVIERRLAACNACEHQAPAPDTLIYRGARVAVGPDAKICTLCHCLTNSKAALASEHCPARDTADPAQSRWGEPWIDPSAHPTWLWQG